MGDTANELHGKLKKADERVAYLERTLDYVLAYSGAKKPVRAAAPETAAVVESEAVADGSTNNEDSGDKENSEADGGNENTVTEGGVAAGGKAARKASRKAPVTKKKRGGSTNKGKKMRVLSALHPFVLILFPLTAVLFLHFIRRRHIPLSWSLQFESRQEHNQENGEIHQNHRALDLENGDRRQTAA